MDNQDSFDADNFIHFWERQDDRHHEEKND